MKIVCQDCKNLVSINCIDTVDISCRYGHKVVYDLHECKDGNLIYIVPTEDYKRGYLHGYNQCRNDVRESLSRCLPDIPKEMKNMR